jgi:hypothetical protein
LRIATLAKVSNLRKVDDIQMMHGCAFSLAALRLGVSQALEYGATDQVNGFILPILSILLADQPG